MITDKLLREKLRVERELVGDAHPFIVTSMTVIKGVEVMHQVPVDREAPTAYTGVWEHGKWCNGCAKSGHRGTN